MSYHLSYKISMIKLYIYIYKQDRINLNVQL